MADIDDDPMRNHDLRSDLVGDEDLFPPDPTEDSDWDDRKDMDDWGYDQNDFGDN